MADRWADDGGRADDSETIELVSVETGEVVRLIPRSPVAFDRDKLCPMCDGFLLWLHSHYECRQCGWRDSCCEGE